MCIEHKGRKLRKGFGGLGVEHSFQAFDLVEAGKTGLVSVPSLVLLTSMTRSEMK